MASGSRLLVDDIWQSVALEERLELISKCQASGMIAAIVNLFVVGSIAYGFDKISLLAAAVAGSFFVFPLFSSYTWRNGKPSIILAYLAVRTLARRYAYSFDFSNLDIMLIYKGHAKQIFSSKEEEELFLQKQKVDINFKGHVCKPVWIVLLRGGVIILSEKKGGAKLEFVTPFTHENTIVDTDEDVEPHEKGCIIDGTVQSKGKKFMIKTRYKAAQYVFEKQYASIVEEFVKAQESLEKLRQKG
jgi:hypothetical protein